MLDDCGYVGGMGRPVRMDVVSTPACDEAAQSGQPRKIHAIELISIRASFAGLTIGRSFASCCFRPA